MKIKNRFFALLVLCLSSLLFFSCAKVDDAASASGINEYGDLNDGYVYIPVGLGLSVDEGESTRTLKHKGYYTSLYLMYYDYVMYYGPEDEPRKYSCDVKLEQSEISLEGLDEKKYEEILLQIKEQDLGKNFCFSLVGARKGNLGTSEGWKLSSKGKIITGENTEGIESITLSKSTAAFKLDFTFDTIDSLGDEGAKGKFQLNFKPTINISNYHLENYHVVVLLCKEVDGEYVEVYGNHFESVGIETGVSMDSTMIECGQYLIKIYAYVPEEDEGENAGKCFGMYSSILEIYGGHNEYYYVGADRTFETYHVVPTAPVYSVAKAKADELGGFSLAE